ncbi:tRNA uracil 4-sulfurtransferase ThiI [Pisciglobus halotolerans]|uniref:Probable tRNA sulfurtransferase n=1 Tax=Pisciglobus halotolerans TaxID=745365 RepID=A0A1I3BWK6_9LACT|nr:tRNA uracil 4-sulfurtransferase ThiI [Pisciglobus halotolerans]SFH66319.1 thiamine biosynthesis protein ThiI [Pisciglobus halotolerans]
MLYNEVMIRYGELSTKGKNKKAFINRLAQNVKAALHDFEEIKVHADRDRMHLILNGADSDVVMERLTFIFGIQNFSPVMRLERDMEIVKKTAVEMVREQYSEGKTFKISTRRADHDFELDTNEMNQLLGGEVLKNIEGIKVQVKKPDINLRVEVRLNGIFLSCQTVQGAGGLPVGTSGKGMLMLSGGIDSPVAGYLAMKRGVEVEAVHFHSPPYTSPRALQKAKDLTAKIAAFSGTIQFIEVPFTEIQEEIKKSVPEGYLMTVTRRMMMRLTDKIREQRKGLAIFNGESLGQVASQTMHSMIAINDVTTTPVLRPVISMDKNEIIEIAKTIDTFELSIQPFEDCCTIFAPPSPKTKPDLDKAREYESRLDIEGLIERAMANLSVSKINVGQTLEEQQKEIYSDLL